jgi:predicted metal-dependent phosphoesterase TrpH
LSKLLKVEFHCHTLASKDSLVRPEELLERCRRKQIDRVVITDHNSIAGARYARQLDPDRVIVGEEIMTQQGEILAAYVQEEIPAGLSPLEVIARLRDQGAFISVSHPFDTMRGGHWQVEELLKIAPLVDAIETFNARCMLPGYNSEAQRFAKQHNLPGTAGSDAHALIELGTATLLLAPFENPDDLRSVIGKAEFRARLSPSWVHLYSRYAVWRKKIAPPGTYRLG